MSCKSLINGIVFFQCRVAFNRMAPPQAAGEAVILSRFSLSVHAYQFVLPMAICYTFLRRSEILRSQCMLCTYVHTYIHTSLCPFSFVVARTLAEGTEKSLVRERTRPGLQAIGAAKNMDEWRPNYLVAQHLSRPAPTTGKPCRRQNADGMEPCGHRPWPLGEADDQAQYGRSLSSGTTCGGLEAQAADVCAHHLSASARQIAILTVAIAQTPDPETRIDNTLDLFARDGVTVAPRLICSKNRLPFENQREGPRSKLLCLSLGSFRLVEIKLGV
jgi:hypothetical protein